jgi:phosphate butyryltransferase
MPLATFDELFADADARRPRVPVVAVGADDPTVTEALGEARARLWVEPHRTDDPAEAVELVRRGEARLLMKGQIATPALMKAVLHPTAGLRTERVICQVVLMEISAANRRFLLADTGVSTHPNLTQNIDIIRSMVEVAHALGEPRPRVAVMSATEKATEALPDTLQAAELQRLGEAGELGDCVVQGPLSFDLAYAAEPGERKGVAGPVAGAADVMLFPDLVSANLTVKAIMYTADCRYGGVLCGAACPVVFMSRADSALTRLRSLALALRLAPG